MCPNEVLGMTDLTMFFSNLLISLPVCYFLLLELTDPCLLTIHHCLNQAFFNQFGSRASIENPRGWIFFLEFWVFPLSFWIFSLSFFLDFWEINQNISKIFPLLKNLVIKMAYLGVPLEIWPKDEFFSWVFSYLSKVAPRGWVFSLSFLPEFCPWVLVFSAVGVKKKPVVSTIFWSSSSLSLGPQTYPWVPKEGVSIVWDPL